MPMRPLAGRRPCPHPRPRRGRSARCNRRRWRRRPLERLQDGGELRLGRLARREAVGGLDGIAQLLHGHIVRRLLVCGLLGLVVHDVLVLGVIVLDGLRTNLGLGGREVDEAAGGQLREALVGQLDLLPHEMHREGLAVTVRVGDQSDHGCSLGSLGGRGDGALDHEVDVLGEEHEADVGHGVVGQALELGRVGHGDVAALVGVEAEQVVAVGRRHVDLDVVLDGGVDRAGGHGAGGHERAQARPVLDVGDAEGAEDLGLTDLLGEVDRVGEVDGLAAAEAVLLGEVGQGGPGVGGGGDEALAGRGGGALGAEGGDEVLLDVALHVGDHRGVGLVHGAVVAALLDLLQRGLLAVRLERHLEGGHVLVGVARERDVLAGGVRRLGELAGDLLLVERLAHGGVDGRAGGQHRRELLERLGERVHEVDVACGCEGLDVGHSGPFLPLLEEVDVGGDGRHAFLLVLDSEDVLLGGLAWLGLAAGLGGLRRAARRLHDGGDGLRLLGERVLVLAVECGHDGAVEPGGLGHGVDERGAGCARLEGGVLALERAQALLDGRVGLVRCGLELVELLEVRLRAALPLARLLPRLLVECLVVGLLAFVSALCRVDRIGLGGRGLLGHAPSISAPCGASSCPVRGAFRHEKGHPCGWPGSTFWSGFPVCAAARSLPYG
nr:MAG TPA: hypothetical protein [Caudoviricetes sp.]